MTTWLEVGVLGCVMVHSPGVVGACVGSAHCSDVSGTLVGGGIGVARAPRADHAPRRPSRSLCAPSSSRARRAARLRSPARGAAGPTLSSPRRPRRAGIWRGRQGLRRPRWRRVTRSASPRNRAIQVRARRASAGLERFTLGRTTSCSGSISGCRKRLNSTSASAPASSRRRAISPGELKKGLSLTATGTVTAALTRSRMSIWRCSTSRPEISGLTGEVVDVQLDRGRAGAPASRGRNRSSLRE